MEKKFKIWDKKSNKYLEDNAEKCYLVNMYGKIYELDLKFGNLRNLDKKNHIIINNIDRKDKKDNPTYAGDIIEWNNGSKIERSIVFYDDFFKCYCVKMSSNKERALKKRPIYFLEFGYTIIGNIYENKKWIDEYNL